MAEEDFDSFDDEASGFVIKTKKPKIVVAKDSLEEKGTVKFSKASMAKNEAISLSVKNFLIFSKLKDVKARYLVLDLELNNILKSQKVVVSNGSNHSSSWINKSADEYEYKEAIPLYQIPDIMKHLYLRVNNQQEQALDIISLLLDKPLIDFDSNKIELLPKKIKDGQLAFRLPKGKKIEQLSLHYYDSKYGNIDIPIVGEMKQRTVDVTSLPKTPWKKMNDNFSLSVTGYEVRDNIKGHQANKDGQFEIVEIDIESRVYALLAFEPSKRFYLNIGGVHQLKLHPITQALPMGLYASASLSPGSNNKFRLAFYVPKGMENQSRSLMVELKGKDLLIPIKKGIDDSASTVVAKSAVEGTSLSVNGVYTYNNKTLVDITFKDKDDTYATRLHNAFLLNDKEAQKSDTLFGLKEKEVILNDSQKRLFVWFNKKIDGKEPISLTSNIFKSLKLKIDKKPEMLPENLKYFLTKNYPYKHQLDVVDKKVLAMVNTFKSKKAKETKSYRKKQPIATLESIKEKSRFTTIAPLSASAYGEEKVAKLKTVDELIEALKTLEWVPSAYEATTAVYSTPAIFTQGWSSENEMFKAIYEKVKGQDVQFGAYGLSNEGKKALKKLAKNIPINQSIPFIEWQEKGEKRSLVLPFLKPIDEVDKYVNKKSYLENIKEQQATIEMKLTYTPKSDGSSVGSFGMFGGALGGATTTEKSSVIFKKSWNLDEISDMPVDIFFPETTAFYTDNNGTHQDKVHALKMKKIEPKVLTVNITMPDGKLDTYEHHFKKKQALKDVFFTFALATPDMPKGVIEKMEIKRKELFKGIDERKIDPFSILQWGNRAKVYKFIAMQTQYEANLEKILEVQAKRNKNLRSIMTIIEKTPNKKLISSIDLRRVFNNVYGDKNASNSFNIMSGLFNTEAEAKAVPQGRGVLEHWKKYKDPKIVLMYPDNKDINIKMMEKANINKNIISRLRNSKKVWLFPVGVQKNIGWLEIEPKTYRIVSVFENGQYDATTSYSIVDVLISEGTGYAVGFFGGVTVSISTVVSVQFFVEDYKSTLKIAEALAGIIATGVGVATGDTSVDKIFAFTNLVDGGSSRAMGIGKGFTMSLAGREDINLMGKKIRGSSAVKGVFGWANGFGDGVTYYFSQANKSK